MGAPLEGYVSPFNDRQSVQPTAHGGGQPLEGYESPWGQERAPDETMGIGETAGREVMGGLATMGRFSRNALGTIAGVADYVHSRLTGKDETGIQDAVFRTADSIIKPMEEIANKPGERSLAGEIVGGIANIPSFMLSWPQHAIDTAQEMVARGATTWEAVKVAGPQAVLDAALQIPAAGQIYGAGARVATRLGARKLVSGGASLLSGAATGIGLGVAGRAAQNATLPDRPEFADMKQDAIGTPAQLALDAAMGSIAGHMSAAHERAAEQIRKIGADKTMSTADKLRAIQEITGKTVPPPKEPGKPGETPLPGINEPIPPSPSGPRVPIELNPAERKQPLPEISPDIKGINISDYGGGQPPPPAGGETPLPRIEGQPAPAPDATAVPRLPEAAPPPPPKSDRQAELERNLGNAEEGPTQALLKKEIAAEAKRTKDAWEAEQKQRADDKTAADMRAQAHDTTDPKIAAKLLAEAEKLSPMPAEPPAPRERPVGTSDQRVGAQLRHRIAIEGHEPEGQTDVIHTMEAGGEQRAGLPLAAPAEAAHAPGQPAPPPTAGAAPGKSPLFQALHDDLGGIHLNERDGVGMDGKPGKGTILMSGKNPQGKMRGPLFNKRGALMDKITDWMLQKGYMSPDDARAGDAILPGGGAHEIARELIRKEIREPGSVKPLGEGEHAWESIKEHKRGLAMQDEAQRLGIDTKGRTTDEIADDINKVHDTRHLSEHGLEPLHGEDARAIHELRAADPAQAAAIEQAHWGDPDHTAFMADVRRALDAHTAAVDRGGQRDEPGPGGQVQEPAVRGEPAPGAEVPAGRDTVRGEQGPEPGQAGGRTEAGPEIQPAGAERGAETPAEAGEPVSPIGNFSTPKLEAMAKAVQKRVDAAEAKFGEAEKVDRRGMQSGNEPREKQESLRRVKDDLKQINDELARRAETEKTQEPNAAAKEKPQASRSLEGARRERERAWEQKNQEDYSKAISNLNSHVEFMKTQLDNAGLSWLHEGIDYRVNDDLPMGADANAGWENGQFVIEVRPEAVADHPNTVAKLMLHEHAHPLDWGRRGLYSTDPVLHVEVRNGKIEPVGEAAKELFALAKTNPILTDLLRYPLDPRFGSLHADPRAFEGELFAQGFVARALPELREVLQNEAPTFWKFMGDVRAHAREHGEFPQVGTVGAAALKDLRDTFREARDAGGPVDAGGSDRALSESAAREPGAGPGTPGAERGTERAAADAERAADNSELRLNEPPQAHATPPPPTNIEEAKPLLERVREQPLLKGAREIMGGFADQVLKHTAPMVLGSKRAMAMVKDWANADRLARWQWQKFHEFIIKGHTPERRTEMYNAGEEENQMRLKGEVDPNRGLGRLTDDERDTMKVLHDYGDHLMLRAKEVGMIDPESGVPYWVPHAAAMIGDDGIVRQVPRKSQAEGSEVGTNLTVTAPSARFRKWGTIQEAEAAGQKHYGKDFKIVRDIATMPMAMGRLERAIAGRDLINHIKEIGERTGQSLVQLDPNEATHFTINHPAFTTYEWKKGSIPISEAHDQQLWDQLHKVAGALGVKHERLAQLRQGGNSTWGVAQKGGGIKTRFAGPETVLTHELGHQIDFKYGLQKEMQGTPGVAQELRDLADQRYAGKDPANVSQYYKDYVRKGTEQMANLVHAYVHAPELLERVAPKAKALFEKFLDKHPEIGEPLREAKPSVTLGSRSQDIGFKFPQRVPLHVAKEFEGPLRSILNDGPNSKAYNGLMGMKTLAVESIMYSPAIHLSVVLGRILPAAPGRLLSGRLYMDGARALADEAGGYKDMRRAIGTGGMAPIGKFGARQDITGVTSHVSEDPREQTWAQAPVTKVVSGALSAVGMEKASLGAAKGLYKAADVWHNQMLWNHVAKLQMGLYLHAEEHFIKNKGLDPDSAARAAGIMANRYAGSVPNESTSPLMRKFLNLEEFSRQFTTGNLGAVKDAAVGMEQATRAQIERDVGPEMANKAQQVFRNKSRMIFALDVALMYGGASTLQDYFKHKIDPNAPEGIPGTFKGLATGDMERVKEAMRGYDRRMAEVASRVHDNPLHLLNPFQLASEVESTEDNEPGKKQRILVGYGADGSARYYRFSLGKVGEDFVGWLTHFHDMLANKQSTLVRPMIQIMANNKGFNGSDRQVWDENAVKNLGLPVGAAKIAGQIAAHFMSAQVPMDALKGIPALAQGKLGWEDMDAVHTVGPLAGLQFSKGFPGGPAVGEVSMERKRYEQDIARVGPDIREALHNGDRATATKLMNEVHMRTPDRQMFFRLATHPGLSGGALKRFMQTATPEERSDLQRLRHGE